MKNEVVSIMIPCYNAEKYLDNCLSSLLNQTYKNIEVIVVNDGSTDNSKKIINSYIEKFKENNMKLLLINQTNKGQAAAIDSALKLVSGDYIMWQDADDWYELDAIESLINCLKEKKLNFVRGEVANRYENDIDNVSYYSRSSDKIDKNIFNDYIFERDSYCYPGIWLVKTKYFDKCIKNRTIYTSRAGQNWQLILPLAFYEKCGYLDKVIYNYRIIDSSHSHSVKKFNELLKRCDEHEDILFNVISNIDEIKGFNLLKLKFKIKIKYYKKKIIILFSTLKKRLGDIYG